MDIYLFGSPQNYDNSPTEHGLIDTAKQPADHAQKSKKMFISQVTKWLLETMLIKKAKASLLCSCNAETCHISVHEFSKKLAF